MSRSGRRGRRALPGPAFTLGPCLVVVAPEQESYGLQNSPGSRRFISVALETLPELRTPSPDPGDLCVPRGTLLLLPHTHTPAQDIRLFSAEPCHGWITAPEEPPETPTQVQGWKTHNEPGSGRVGWGVLCREPSHPPCLSSEGYWRRQDLSNLGSEYLLHLKPGQELSILLISSVQITEQL